MGACQSLPSLSRQSHELSLQLTTKDQTPQSRDLQKQDHLFESLDFFIPFKSDYFSFKKLATLSKPLHYIKSACYIPQTNLLLALSGDSTISIYNTMKKSKLMAKEISQNQLDIITYSKELGKIILGGDFLQILNPKTFQVEAQSQFPDYSYRLNIVYTPISHVFVVKTATNLVVYDRGLTLLMSFPFPSYDGKTWSSTLEIFEISKDLLLGLYHEKNSKLFLLNLKKKSIKKYDRLYLRYGSCLQMTQEGLTKLFTCLAIRKSKRLSYNGKYPFKVVHFAIDPKTEELVILKISNTNHYFETVKRLGNTKYFLAEKFDHYDEIVVISLNNNYIEVSKIISPFNNLSNFALIMLKDRSSIVDIDNNGMCLYRFTIQSDHLETSIDSESSLEFCAPVDQRKTGIKT